MDEQIIASRYGENEEVVKLTLDNFENFVIKVSSDNGRTTRSVRLSPQQLYLLKQCMREVV